MEVPPQIQIGPFRVSFLSDGLWRNDGGCMFGVVPRELWRRDHPPDERNRIVLNLTCPLIVEGTDAILVDTGIGNRLSAAECDIFAHGEGALGEGLRALGMEPGDVTHVILSHLHFDHCGGMVRRTKSGKLEPAFPRARYLVQRGELELARNSANERLRAAYRHVAECLEPIGARLELLTGTTELRTGVTAVVTGGHTADHQIVLVEAGDGHFAHLADIVPTRSHLRGPWNQSYDLDPLRTMEEKARYLARASDWRWWISFAHDERLFAARVGQDGGKTSLREGIAVAPAAAVER